MILDDEEDMGIVLAHMIRRAGFVVETFATPEAALVAFADFNPAVILCDLNMPAMTGLEFRKRVPAAWQGEFVLLTGDITTNVDEIYTTGIKHVLFKPKDLMRVIPLLKDLTPTTK